jgi:ABC-2 type transport system ATP-binding protein
MINLQDISFNYNGRKTADLFHQLNLEIKSGTICGLLGKNGAGKTTLLRLIIGLLFPTHGSCQVMQHEPRKREPFLLRDIYFIPEEFHVPPITIRAYVNLFSPFYEKFSHADLDKYLQEFSLPFNKKLTTLSYGQKKKFLVAFALATNCRLLLLDEPTNGLDIPSKSQFRKLLASSCTIDKTIIISTHQVRDLQNLLDSIVILDNGKIIFNQTINAVTEKLQFTGQQNLPDTSDVIYAEKILGGYMTLKPKTNDAAHASEADLEILFNAVTNHPEKIQSLF